MNKNDRKRKTRTGSKIQETVPAFLLKTYEIIEDPEYNDIISWNREGNAFVVKKINDFSEKILPKYFKHNNFASFVRQLNMYDFHKSRHENNENEFRHKLFRRGQKHLLKDIKRKISDGQTVGNTQLVPATGNFDIDKFKKDTTQFTDELGTIKRHQNDLEKVTKMIYNQNSQLLKENKLLWNELIKNKEKYEKKIEKLLVFIFSVARSGTQLGPSEERKSLTNSDLSLTLQKLTSDSDQSKKYLGTDENGPLNVLPDKQENEKMMERMTKFLHDKGSEANIDSLLEQLQNGHSEDIFKPQAETADEDLGSEVGQSYDPNASMITGPDFLPRMPSRRGRQLSGRSGSALDEIDENQDFSRPTKQLKTEGMPMYNNPRNVMSAQEPINMMNQDLSEEGLRRGMSAYNLDLSRGPSFNTDMNNIRAPALIPQKSSMDYLYTSPKNFNNNMKEDEITDMYNIDDKNVMGYQPENKPELGAAYFTPVTYMGNPNPNVYSYGPAYDDQMYKN